MENRKITENSSKPSEKTKQKNIILNNKSATEGKDMLEKLKQEHKIKFKLPKKDDILTK